MEAGNNSRPSSLADIQKVHMIGVCGIGMSGVAMLYADNGFTVQGSDEDGGYTAPILEQAGIQLFVGHAASHLGPDIDLVVISSAIKEDNPELAAARRIGIPVISRAEALRRIIGLFASSISITGTHGKTTTTAMVATVMSSDGLHPTVVNGGIINAAASNLILGGKEIIILESDESDGSFLALRGKTNIITNLEADHLDYYKSMENLFQSFFDFIKKSSEDGDWVIVCGDDGNLWKIVEQLRSFPQRTPGKNDSAAWSRIITYGFSPHNDVVISQDSINHEGISFSLRAPSEPTAIPLDKLLSAPSKKAFIPCYGKHNILNATAALLAGLANGLNFLQAVQNLACFSGVERRFTITGSLPGKPNTTVVDDYAHHPTELTAVVEIADAWRNFKKNGAGRIIVVVQPHRYSRFTQCYNDFAEHLHKSKADVVIVLPIFSAREIAEDYTIEGRTISQNSSHIIVDLLKEKGGRHELFFIQNDNIIQEIREIAREHDIIICTGAGNITKYARLLTCDSS